MNSIHKFFNIALKKAELMMGNQHLISDLIDKAFVKMGKYAERLYDVQDQLLGLIRMLKAWAKREYTEVSPKAIVSILAAIIYFVNPFDLISDVIPFVGFLDDITVITYIVTLFNKEIERFMDWEKSKATN